MTAALQATRHGGVLGLVAPQSADWNLDTGLLIGKTVKMIFVGDAPPRQLIPELIALWREGKFPFDRLIETFPLSKINEAEEAALSGRVIKPVLLPDSDAHSAASSSL
eukprot:TRINITY_DN27983_c0_g1_i3.p2 TRINITY_DN27983_c0_g1~~TRINITY_DN27983_c0_g1_i3.p2  ORF type:complete len:108 (+),score=21.34 TRINITY_DN27983_c0_g1_i3:266-589(+)